MEAGGFLAHTSSVSDRQKGFVWNKWVVNLHIITIITTMPDFSDPGACQGVVTRGYESHQKQKPNTSYI